MNLLSRFRRARRSAPTASRPCGCPTPYCPEAEAIIARVHRGRRVAGQYGDWADHNQALVELSIHLQREPSECWSLLRHPAGR